MAFVNLLQAVYPVGSVYISAIDTSPASTIGGTWEQVTNRYLYATTIPASLGGSSTHSHSLSTNGGACIDIIGEAGNGSTYWVNVLSKSSGKTFDIQYNAAYLVNNKNNSTITNQQHAIALMGDTDNSNYQPAYYGICTWVRTA